MFDFKPSKQDISEIVKAISREIVDQIDIRLSRTISNNVFESLTKLNLNRVTGNTSILHATTGLSPEDKQALEDSDVELSRLRALESENKILIQRVIELHDKNEALRAEMILNKK